MSDPPTTPLLHHQQQPLYLHHHSAAATSSNAVAVPIPREYRKGNWTLQETLILITAKRHDDERRLRLSSTTTDPSSSAARTSGELRWKWVENYCWSHGCLRSQNQCNDKWDNLLRDYKKVRDYESKSETSSSSNTDLFPSYWTLDKHQRKQRNLPSNMIFDVYKAISEVLQRKHSHRTPTTTTTTQDVVIPVSAVPLPAVELLTSPLSHPNPVTIVTPPPPPPPPPEAAPAPATGVSEKSESSSTEYSDEELEEEEEGEEELEEEEEVQVREESEAKPRKVRNLGSSIMRSASVIARALRSCEEKKAKRHRQMMELENRRLKIEEDRVEVNRQGIASLVSAVTNLSGAIQSLISDQRHHR